MHKLIRYINQNRRKILLTIAVIVGIIIIIQFLNGVAERILNSGTSTTNNNVNTSSVYQPNKTIMSNTVVKENVAKDNSEIIDKFFKYCKSDDIQEAYDLLTEECKEKYPSIEKFKKNYCENIFSNKESYNIQSWMTYEDNYTYKVRFTENLLATGKSNSGTKEDYITIINTNNGLKLNVNSFVSRQIIDKTEKEDNIIIKVKYKDIYIDKEEYLISVTNNTENDIMLDSLDTTTGINLLGDSNKMSYQAFSNELSRYDVTVPVGNAKRIKIKFSKEYNPGRPSKRIVFSDIILNIEKYKEDSNDEKNKAKIIVDV